MSLNILLLYQRIATGRSHTNIKANHWQNRELDHKHCQAYGLGSIQQVIDGQIQTAAKCTHDQCTNCSNCVHFIVVQWIVWFGLGLFYPALWGKDLVWSCIHMTHWSSNCWFLWDLWTRCEGVCQTSRHCIQLRKDENCSNRARSRSYWCSQYQFAITALLILSRGGTWYCKERRCLMIDDGNGERKRGKERGDEKWRERSVCLAGTEIRSGHQWMNRCPDVLTSQPWDSNHLNCIANPTAAINPLHLSIDT